MPKGIMTSRLKDFIKDQRFLDSNKKEQWYFFRVAIHKLFYQMSPLEKNALLKTNFEYLHIDVENEEKYKVIPTVLDKLRSKYSSYTKDND